jgi:transcriptional regulator
MEHYRHTNPPPSESEYFAQLYRIYSGLKTPAFLSRDADKKDYMYTPSVNAEKDVPTLRRFVQENPLCALVTQTGAGLVASHIPMMLYEDNLGFGTLKGHVARANSQWQDFNTSEDALAIFTGPQHYVSASWYPSKATHGKEVPTWNYVAVHVYGRMRIVEDSDWLLEHLRDLTDKNEQIVETPWRVDDAPQGFIAKLSKAIVGIELVVSRVEGKWKVSQNRSEQDAAGVIKGLDSIGTPASTAMKELVSSRRPR